MGCSSIWINSDRGECADLRRVYLADSGTDGWLRGSFPGKNAGQERRRGLSSLFSFFAVCFLTLRSREKVMNGTGAEAVARERRRGQQTMKAGVLDVLCLWVTLSKSEPDFEVTPRDGL